MAVVLGLQALEEINKLVIGLRITQPVLVYHLFTNNYNPTKDSEEADFVEVARAGYAARTLNPASWTFTFPADTYSLATFADFAFLFNAAAGVTTLIRGWYVLDEGVDPPVFMWGERTSDVSIPPAGGSLLVSTFKTEKQC